MTILSYLVPRTVLRTSSPYNRDIRVVEEWGQLKLLVNGSRESGPYIKTLWEGAFREFHLEAIQNVTSILVLGVGGGTVIKLLASQYPEAVITAVDIDQTVIDIAKKYFRLDQIKNLRILKQDAYTFVTNRHRQRANYDLIIVDLFIGRDIPDFVAHRDFYLAIKRRLLPGGSLIINYLRELGYEVKSEKLQHTLHHIFVEVRDYPCFNKSNRFFFARG